MNKEESKEIETILMQEIAELPLNLNKLKEVLFASSTRHWERIRPEYIQQGMDSEVAWELFKDAVRTSLRKSLGRTGFN